jgi:hypothetical protein
MALRTEYEGYLSVTPLRLGQRWEDENTVGKRVVEYVGVEVGASSICSQSSCIGQMMIGNGSKEER